mgnify:FL=1
MKIVHVLLSLKGGGIQNFLLSLIPEQIKMGHTVSVIVTDEDNLEYSSKNKKYLETLGVKVYNLDRKVSDKVSFFQTWFKARNIIKSINPDIVNSHSIYSHDAAAFATWGTKFKHCCTIHNAPEPWDRISKLMNRNVPLIFCSDAALELREQESCIMTAINNGIDINLIRTEQTVDLHKELSIPSDEKIVVLVGSTRPQKNYQLLIKIVEVLNNSKIHFCICGGQYKVSRKGSNNNSYINLDQFDKYGNIHILGLRNDVPAVLNGADAYLSCSLKEGLPISALEGFFSGIPCILSPIVQHTNIAVGVADCFIPNSFDPKDFIKSIYQALECKDSHDDIYKKREEALRVFRIDRCAKEYIDFYNQILNEK